MAEGSLALLRRCGGHIALDFLNTVDWRGRAQPDEYLRAYADLLLWCELAGVLSHRESQRLKRATERADGLKVLEDAIDLRESTYRVVFGVINGRKPKENDLRVLDNAVREARNQLKLVYEDAHLGWHLPDEVNARFPLWSVALSVADLIAPGNLRHIRECGSRECGWLFLDTSKSRTRRWCTMEGCGNRAKARRHYAKVIG